MGRPLLVTADIQTLPTSEFFNSLRQFRTWKGHDGVDHAA